MLIDLIKNDYLLDIKEIEKSDESTVGNVYIIHTEELNYVAKVYDDLLHIQSMTKLHSFLFNNNFNVPNIIHNKDNLEYTIIDKDKYIVLYSFLNEVPFNISFNLSRKSVLHFDLTKMNILYDINNTSKIGFIDFDDAKYGPSVCDLAIISANLFFSKKRGVDLERYNAFINSYYGLDLELKEKEKCFIKECAIKWLEYTLKNDCLDSSIKDSFLIKIKLIEGNILV